MVFDAISSHVQTIDGNRRDKELVFFSLSTCAMCKKGQQYLNDNGYAYRMIYVDLLDPAEKERLKQDLSEKCGFRVVFPALLIGKNNIVLGFVRSAWDNAFGEKSSGD